MRIVALQAIRSRKRLVRVGLAQAIFLWVVAVEAKLRRGFRQVLRELELGGIAGLMNGVAGVAAHIQRQMPAPLFRNTKTGCVAAEAKIFLLLARNRLHQLRRIRRLMGIMALDAVADRGWMYSTVYVRSVLFRVARQTQLAACGGDQFDVSDALSNTDFVAARAALCHSGVNVGSLSFVVMAFQALGGVRVRFQRDRMFARMQARS